MNQSMSNLHMLNIYTPNRERYHLTLNGFLKNLTSNLEQNRSSHSYGYDFHDISPTFFVIFSRNSVPFIKYAG